MFHVKHSSMTDRSTRETVGPRPGRCGRLTAGFAATPNFQVAPSALGGLRTCRSTPIRSSRHNAGTGSSWWRLILLPSAAFRAVPSIGAYESLPSRPSVLVMAALGAEVYRECGHQGARKAQGDREGSSESARGQGGCAPARLAPFHVKHRARLDR
jgi:hypothetical protein